MVLEQNKAMAGLAVLEQVAGGHCMLPLNPTFAKKLRVSTAPDVMPPHSVLDSSPNSSIADFLLSLLASPGSVCGAMWGVLPPECVFCCQGFPLAEVTCPASISRILLGLCLACIELSSDPTRIQWQCQCPHMPL